MPVKGHVSPQWKEVSETHKERIWGADTKSFAHQFPLPNLLEAHLQPAVPCTSGMQMPPPAAWTASPEGQWYLLQRPVNMGVPGHAVLLSRAVGTVPLDSGEADGQL